MTGVARARDRYLAQLLGATLWLGAFTLFAAVVAPAAFRVLPGRSVAGALIGAVLPSLFLSGMILGAALCISAAVVRGRRVTTVTVAGFLMAVSCAVGQLVIGPRIERVRASIGGPVEALAPSDPRRIEFGRLHGASVLWLGVAALSAAIAGGRTALMLRRER